MRKFGVGRPAVREALFHLRKMGLVEMRSGERARVTRPTPRIVIDTLAGTARHMLAAPGRRAAISRMRASSSRSGSRATRRSTPPTRTSREFEAALAANRQSLGDLSRFQRTDVDFHYVLAVIPRNPIFTAIHAALAEWLLEQRQTTLRARARTSSPTRRTGRSSRRSPRATPDRAEAAMRAHLDYVARRYIEIVGRRQ